MSDWQPIETAPKDGRELLVGRFAFGRNWQCVSSWRGPSRGEHDYPYGDNAWRDSNGRHLAGTHWMPLPEPPS